MRTSKSASGEGLLRFAKIQLLIGLLMFLLRPSVVATGEDTKAKGLAEAVFRSAKVKGGLCVHLGCGDGKLTVELARAGNLLVQGLSSDHAEIDKARRYIQEQKLYGQISIVHSDFSSLPYAENMVNLVVIDDLRGLLKAGLSMKEVMRVTCPNGSIALRDRGGLIPDSDVKAKLAEAGIKLKSLSGWANVRKPRPKEMDDWTHKGYDAGNAPTSKDAAVGPLSGVRWIMGPYWPFLNKRSVKALVAAGGRLFFISWNDTPNLSVTMNKAPGQTFLIARDAFNGLRLWTRPFPTGFKPVDPAELDGLTGKARGGPIRAHFDVFSKLGDLLVAVGDRVYTVLDGEVVALNAATGETVKVYEKGTSPNKLVVHKGDLILAGKESVRMFDLGTGKLRWESPFKATSIVVGDGRVFALDDSNHRKHIMAGLDLKTGQEQWRTTKGPWTGWTKYRSWFYGKGVLAFGHGKRSGTLEVFSAEDGKKLWSTKGFQWVDVFLVDGLLWVRRKEKINQTSADTDVFEVGLDPLTGEPRSRLKVGSAICNGCYRSIALERYFLGTRPLTFISREDGKVSRFSGGRHMCAIGVIPANGLIYSTPHECKCTLDAIRGYVAFAPADKKEKTAAKPSDDSRLQKGPAFGKLSNSKPRKEDFDSWPTFRHDWQRSGSTKTAVPVVLKRLWEVTVEDQASLNASLKIDWKANPLGGDPLTQPVVVGESVFVSLVDSHRVIAVDRKTGRLSWSFTAGGRLDTPPSIHEELCLFGAADGWVYCLRAEDGKLVWRYRAAPEEKQVIAFGQLESKWPVVGGVLVEGGVAYCVAGRGSAIDGGIYLYALDPETGECLKTTRHRSGGMCDILASNGRRIFMVNGRVDKGVVMGAIRSKSPAGLLGHLVGTGRQGRVLDRSWQMASAKEVPPYEVPVGKPKPLDSKQYQYCIQRYALAHSFWGCQGQLVVGEQDKKRAFCSVSIPPERWGGKVEGWEDGKSLWTFDVPEPFQIESMVLAGDVLFAAGPSDRFHPDNGGFLWAFSAKDGKKLNEVKLEVPPVSEGLAAAEGRLYISTRDSKLICFGK